MKNLSLQSPINSLGYGVTGRNIALALKRLGVRVALFPLGQSVEKSLVDSNIEEMLNNREFFQADAPSLKIWHQFDMAEFIGKGKHIGFPIFELDTFTPREIHHLNSTDEVFVCSEWAKGVCLNNGIKVPVKVVNLGVDTNIFQPASVSTTGPTVFFNCGKWEVRKGHDLLADAFKKAFSVDDNVLLIMCCSNPFLSAAEEANWTNRYKNPKIRVISRLPSHADVATMINHADCGDFPSRAEGWNLEAIETLACGRQLIITDYSAHTEFCNADNSYLIPVRGTEVAQDGKWFFGQGNWAKVYVDDIAHQMRIVHETKQRGLLRLNDNGVQTASRLTWNNTAKRILEHLDGTVVIE